MIANPDVVAKTLNLKNVGSQYQGACPVCGGHDRFWITKQGKYGCRQCSDNTALTKAVKDAGGDLPDSPNYQRDRGLHEAHTIDFRQADNSKASSGSITPTRYGKKINTHLAIDRQSATAVKAFNASGQLSLGFKSTPAERAIELPPAAVKAEGSQAYGTPVDPDGHHYVKLKKMRSEDCYIGSVPEFGGKLSLVIPIRTHDGVVVGYQAIDTEQDSGDKFQRRNNRGFDKSGVAVSLASKSVGDLAGKKSYLVEGWATGLALINSGFHAVWMLDANHLAQNAKRLAATYPDVEFIVAADNDEAGIKAAKESGLAWVVPPEDGQDFWDLYATEGSLGVIQATQSVIDAKAIAPQRHAVTCSQMESVVYEQPNAVANGQRNQGKLQIGLGGRFDFKDWIYITTDEVFRNIRTGVENRKPAFDLAYSQFVPKHIDGQVKASDYVVKYLQQVVERSIYLPSKGEVFSAGKSSKVMCCNRYITANIPDVPDDWKGHQSWQLLDKHLKLLLPDDWKLLLQWMAHNVQLTGEKIRWAPLIKGAEGDGKSTLGYALSAVMGYENVSIINPEEIIGNFTGWSDNAAVGVIEEIKIPSAKKQEVMNKLKPVITNSQISVERKGKDSYNAPNCCNYIALTNHEDAISIDHRDRRWAVLFTPYETRDDVDAAMGGDYFSVLYEAIDNNAGAIRGWLLNVDLTGFDALKPPSMTQAKQQMIQSSKSDSLQAVEEVIRLGAVGVSADVISTQHLNDALRNNGDRELTTSYAAKVMDEAGYVKFDQPLKWDGGKRTVYISKALSEALKGSKAEVQRVSVREKLNISEQENRFGS